MKMGELFRRIGCPQVSLDKLFWRADERQLYLAKDAGGWAEGVRKSSWDGNICAASVSNNFEFQGK